MFQLFDQVPHKLEHSVTEDGKRLKKSDLGKQNSVVKKTIINCVVNMKLTCVHNFAFKKMPHQCACISILFFRLMQPIL